MFFKDVIGQQSVKERLVRMVNEDRVSHALLFTGAAGSGLLPMALAFAQYLNCENPESGDSCGVCPSCKKIAKLVHPDLHFVFPIVKMKDEKNPVCSDYMKQWREFVGKSPYFTEHQWYSFLNADRAQGIIYTQEGSEIIRKLSLKSYEGKYKIMVIWLPEKMHPFAANKLLKILEEPPPRTIFILASDYPAGLLTTILSRTQQIILPRIGDHDIEKALMERFDAPPAQARLLARTSEGNFIKACNDLEQGEDSQLIFDSFRQLMRSAYSRNLPGMMQWVDTTAGKPREQLKNLLSYVVDMLRESFMANFNIAELVYAGPGEEDFIDKFKPFVTDRNIQTMVEEVSLALSHIEQNGNSKLVLFDMSLKLSDLFV